MTERSRTRAGAVNDFPAKRTLKEEKKLEIDQKVGLNYYLDKKSDNIIIEPKPHFILLILEFILNNIRAEL